MKRRPSQRSASARSSYRLNCGPENTTTSTRSSTAIGLAQRLHIGAADLQRTAVILRRHPTAAELPG